MMVAKNFFLKNKLAVMNLARDFLVIEPGERIPPINYYVEAFSMSRGTIQSAMLFLSQEHCITTQFKGPLGTILLSKDSTLLWDYSGFGSLVGAMSLPLNGLVSGLATGICECMKAHKIAFNCAFIQGSRTRLEGLVRNKHDFIVASQLTTTILMNQYEDVYKAMDLNGCAYSGKYILMFRKGLSKIKDGMTVSLDPSSLDQTYLTELVCRNKEIKRLETSYINTRLSVINGKADFTVARTDTVKPPQIPQCYDLVLPNYTSKEIEEFSNTVILASKSNYGIDKLLKYVLDPDQILDVQNQVIEGLMPPLYY